MTYELPFFIIGIKTPDKTHYQLLTCKDKETAEKLASLVHETIRVTGGTGIVDITEVKE